MRFLSRFAVIFLAGMMAAASTVAAGAERYRCDTEAIRDCSPAGCTGVHRRGSISLDLAARTYRRCLGAECRAGAVEMWAGTAQIIDKGFVGFEELGREKGFSGSVDFDTGQFVLIDGSRFWHGRCKAE